LTSWYWTRALDCHLEARREIALWYFEKVIADRPTRWLPFAHRAEVYRAMDGIELARADEFRAVANGADPIYLQELAEDRALEGDWDAAKKLVSIATSRGRADPLTEAYISLKDGDRDRWRKATAALLVAAEGNSSNRLVVQPAIWAIGLAPHAVDDYSRSLGLATSFMATTMKMKQGGEALRRLRHDAHQTLAALLFRAGKSLEARVELARASSEGLVDFHDDLFATLIDLGLGDLSRAPDRLRKIREAMPTTLRETRNWRTRIEYEALYAEAERALLEVQFPAVPFR
jgi:hypothetical protein